MKYINNLSKTPNKSYFKSYLNQFWFIPSDVLQRSIEANIWGILKFKHPMLEIGIGNGEISSYLFSKIKKIDMGIDIEAEGLALAKETGKYIKVRHEDASEMSFPDGSFNSVVSNSTFEHIKYDEKAISEVSRVLKSDGLLYITVPDNFLLSWIMELEGNNKKVVEKFNKRANHLHYRSIDEWKSTFKKNNMELIFFKYYFKKNIAIFWYKTFKLFTSSVNNKELWSYLGHSKISKIIPKKLVIKLLYVLLIGKFKQGFFTKDNGAMLFMIAKKNNY